MGAMFFRSPVLLMDKSKRLAVKLASSMGTGFAYWTVPGPRCRLERGPQEKSPLKKDIRMALRKYVTWRLLPQWHTCLHTTHIYIISINLYHIPICHTHKI